MSVSIETLQSIEIFADLDHEEIEHVLPIIHRMRVKEGEILAKKGHTAINFYVNIDGNFMISFENRKAITLHEKGDIMGWSTLVTPFEYRGSVVALTDGDVFTISGEEFYRLLQADASIAGKIMKKINAIAASRTALSED